MMEADGPFTLANTSMPSIPWSAIKLNIEEEKNIKQNEFLWNTKPTLLIVKSTSTAVSDSSLAYSFANTKHFGFADGRNAWIKIFLHGVRAKGRQPTFPSALNSDRLLFQSLSWLIHSLLMSTSPFNSSADFFLISKNFTSFYKSYESSFVNVFCCFPINSASLHSSCIFMILVFLFNDISVIETF